MKLFNIGLKRWLLVFLAFAGLAFFYTLQEFDFVDWKQRHFQSFGGELEEGKEVNFVISKLIRFIANDLLCILLIYALFDSRRYVIFGFYVQLFGLVVLLNLVASLASERIVNINFLCKI